MTAMTMVQAINSALDCTMAKDPSVLVLGQDVGFFGGVFRCTEGLYEKYGPHRALDTPIAEGGIVAAAIGMGVNGLRPVVEMQFADYIYPAIDQIISELARLRHRSGGEFWAPVVVRAPCGGGIVESEVSAWRVQVGDLVKEDQVLTDVQTDKAIVEVGSPVSGRVIALGCEAGGVLAVGAELVRFEVEVEPAEDSSSAGSSNLAPHTDTSAAGTSAGEDKVGHASITAINAPTPSVNATNSGSGVLASPSQRRRAREEGIDLAAVPGSGPKGRISHGDLDAFIAAGGELVMQVPGRQRREGKTDVRITGLRRVIALKMQKTKRDIPHYSYIEEVDVTQLEALRVMLNEVRTDAQPKLTLIPFLARALVRALPQFPHCNARFDDVADILTQHAAVHVGIATMTAGGLMVPVVKHCESLDLWQTAAEVARVSAAARDKKAAPAELSGSTITITSLGAIGGIATTPVINAPETAIIGVNKMQQRPVVIDGAIVVRTMMNLSASFDHRIVDGYDGAQLVQALKRMLENPGAIFV